MMVQFILSLIFCFLSVPFAEVPDMLVTKYNLPHGFTEKDLICNRLLARKHSFDVSDKTVLCPKHRYSSGIYFQKNAHGLCSHIQSTLKTPKREIE